MEQLLKDKSPAGDGRGRLRIAVCVATFRRPTELKRLLLAINQLQNDDNFSFRVVVIDNDPRRSATRVCSEIRESVSYPLECEYEPVIGLSSARNRALDCAVDTDFLAFVDDDEEPAPDWLRQLLAVRRRYSAEVVAGPVLSVFDVPAAGWLRSSFERHRPATGTCLREARAGNVLISADFLRRSGVRFDEAFSRTGGEDADFFRRMLALGARIVAADEAIVYERVDEARANARWLLRRAFRIGNADGLFRLKQTPNIARRLMLAAAAIARIGAGAVLAVLSAPAGRSQVLKHARRICRGAGILLAVCGHAHPEYGPLPESPECRR